jgi:hypothetical protein
MALVTYVWWRIILMALVTYVWGRIILIW